MRGTRSRLEVGKGQRKITRFDKYCFIFALFILCVLMKAELQKEK